MVVNMPNYALAAECVNGVALMDSRLETAKRQAGHVPSHPRPRWARLSGEGNYNERR